MKKVKHISVVIILLLACIFGLNNNVEAASKNVSIKLSKEKLTLVKGNSYRLKATVKGTNKKVTWSSSKKSVVTVSKAGYIKTKGAGTAVITAKIGNVSRKCKVTVIDLKAPALTEWRKTHDSATCNCAIPHDGVTYTINWNKIPKASGYQVYYGTNDNGQWYMLKENTKKLSFSTSFSHINMKLKARVRAYVMIDGKKVYGPWSKVTTKTIQFY